MFDDIKTKIIELAKNAVLVAEEKLGTGAGQEKKKMAIEYIVNNLQFSDLVRAIISILLSSFIDDAVEIAVLYMKSLPKTQGD